jgi:ABC-type branched-subunit amino acid transport system ATPase component
MVFMSNNLILNNVGKRFGDCWVLRGVCASVPAGKITAFIGPNGAGKTTLLHVISGALRPDEGAIRFGGTDIGGLPCHRIARMGIGRQFQDVRVFGGLTVLENVVVGLVSHESQDAWRAWVGTRHSRKVIKQHEATATRWIEHVGLQDDGRRLARDLSFGQQKLLSLARLFARGFPFLLLDEPTAGVSPKMVEKITGLIREAVAARDVTVALVEHNMTVVADLAYWIHFLNEGRVAFSGERSHVLGNKSVRQMYMGL